MRRIPVATLALALALAVLNAGCTPYVTRSGRPPWIPEHPPEPAPNRYVIVAPEDAPVPRLTCEDVAHLLVRIADFRDGSRTTPRHSLAETLDYLEPRLFRAIHPDLRPELRQLVVWVYIQPHQSAAELWVLLMRRCEDQQWLRS